MTTTDELRRTLIENASRAPDPVGVVETVRAGAARVHRRRRIAVGVVAVCALLAAVVVRVEVAARDGSDLVTAPPGRGLLRLTADVPWESGYYSIMDKALDAYQSYAVRSGVPGRLGAEVILIDKNAFSPVVLRQGEPIAVRGHRGYRITGPLVAIVGPVRTPASEMSAPAGSPDLPGEEQVVGWLDQSGVWVLLYGRSREELVQIGEALTLGPQRAVRSGVRFGYVPPSLRYAGVTAVGWPLQFDTAYVGFDAADAPPRKATLDELLTTMNSHALRAEFTVTRLAGDTFVEGHPDAVPAGIAGRSAWYTGADELVVLSGSCVLTLRSNDPGLAPREELTRIAEGVEFADCSRRETWFDVP